MNNLYDSLLYNWERGFYSVVQDKWDDYYVVSTKSWNHGFFITEPQLTVIAAKARIGDSKEYSGDLINTLVNPVNGGWKIIENETFHPSELMGKGFQVGDKVKVPRIDGSCEVIKASSGNKDAYEVKLPINYSDMPSQFFTSSELKPVLPVEESKTDLEKLLGCNVIVDGRITGGAVVMVDAKGKAIAMFKEGKIVNL